MTTTPVASMMASAQPLKGDEIEEGMPVFVIKSPEKRGTIAKRSGMRVSVIVEAGAMQKRQWYIFCPVQDSSSFKIPHRFVVGIALLSLPLSLSLLRINNHVGPCLSGQVHVLRLVQASTRSSE